MALLPLYPAQNNACGNTFSWASSWAFFVKVASLPASDMTLLDLDGAGSGYFRTKLTSGGLVIFETSWNGVQRSITCNTGTLLATGVWYFVSCAGQTPANNWTEGHQILLYDRNGTLLASAAGANDQRGAGSAPLTNYRGGIGVTLTTSYLDFPNSAGNEMSKLVFRQCTSQGGSGVILTPSADWSSGLAYYNARQTVGSASSLVDGAGTYTATGTGPNGLTINTDGPIP